jgi:hypothetical protein
LDGDESDSSESAEEPAAADGESQSDIASDEEFFDAFSVAEEDVIGGGLGGRPSSLGRLFFAFYGFVCC